MMTHIKGQLTVAHAPDGEYVSMGDIVRPYYYGEMAIIDILLEHEPAIKHIFEISCRLLK